MPAARPSDPVDDDPEYADDLIDDQGVIDDLPVATNPTTIPADLGDANAALKGDKK